MKALHFQVTSPSAYIFLNRYSKLLKADEVTTALARYLIELPLIEYRMLKYSPSMVAASAIYVAFHILKKKITQNLTQATMYTEQNIRSCAKDLCILFHGINKINLQAVKKKFSSSKFFKVGMITLEHSSKSDKSKKEPTDALPCPANVDEAEIPDEGTRANGIE